MQQIDLVQAGYTAYRLGVTSAACPYKAGDPRCAQWLEGYTKAKRAHVPLFPTRKSNSKQKPRTKLQQKLGEQKCAQLAESFERAMRKLDFKPRIKRGEGTRSLRKVFETTRRSAA